MQRRNALLSVCLAAMCCLSCEQSPMAGLGGMGSPLFAFGVASKATPAPTPTPTAPPSTAAEAPAPTAAPVATPTPMRRSSGGGGRRTPVVVATPTPAPLPPLVPGASQSTIGNAEDRLKIDGFRLDPDFATNGKVHLAFSVFGADGTDITAQMDPAALTATMAFSSEAPSPYRVLAFEQISVVVEGLKAQGRPPLDAVLDLDSTGSMQMTDPNRLRVDGAKGYIDAMRPDDQVAVMDFATGIPVGVPVPLVNFLASRMLHPFSKDRDAAKAAVDQVIELGGTNLYDSMAEAIAYMASQSGNRPRALVVLTDGQDNSSSRTIQDVVADAKANDVLLLLLAFADFDQAAMHGLVSDSGGYFVGAEDASQLEAQYTAAVRTANGNAQAIIYVPEDQRIAQHMAGRITARIDGQDYSGTFNVAQP